MSINFDNTQPNITKSERVLHTPSGFAKDNLLYVQEAGRLTSLKPHKSGRENLESFLLLVVLKGQGSLSVQGKEYEIKQGDVALIDCMNHYEHISSEEHPWELAWVHFNGKSARGYYELILKTNQGRHVMTGLGEANTNAPSWQDKLNDHIGQLMDLSAEKNLLDEMRSSQVLQEILNDCYEQVENLRIAENGNHAAEAIQAAKLREQNLQTASEIRKLLNEKYASIAIIKELEEAFAQSFETLAGSFRAAFGISIEEYISNRRFNAAKELLRFSVKSVDQVAQETGVGDRIALEQLFNAREGMSAEEYRSKWGGWIRG